jgi:hypothetical protein
MKFFNDLQDDLVSAPLVLRFRERRWRKLPSSLSFLEQNRVEKNRVCSQAVAKDVTRILIFRKEMMTENIAVGPPARGDERHAYIRLVPPLSRRRHNGILRRWNGEQPVTGRRVRSPCSRVRRDR